MSEDNSVVSVLHTVRPGRKPGVKTVAESVESVRRNWLHTFLSTRGNNARLCELLNADDSFVSHLAAGRRTFTNAIVERIENVLEIPPGTIDSGGADSVAITVKQCEAEVLNPKLEAALVELLTRALRENRVDNALAIRFISEIVQR